MTNANKVFIEIPQEKTDVEPEAVVVKASPFRKAEESPVSMRGIDILRIPFSICSNGASPGIQREMVVQFQHGDILPASALYHHGIQVGRPTKNIILINGHSVFMWVFRMSIIFSRMNPTTGGSTKMRTEKKSL